MSDSTAREILRELVDATEASRDPSVVGSTCRLIRAEGAAHEYLAAPVAQPSDSKLCPRELTAQMAIAAIRTLPVPSSKTAELAVREIWQAAYDAAPAAPPSDSKPREPLGILWQHQETGRSLVKLADDAQPLLDGRWAKVGQVYLGEPFDAAPAAPGDALIKRIDAAWAAARAVLNDYDAGDFFADAPRPEDDGILASTGKAPGCNPVVAAARAGSTPADSTIDDLVARLRYDAVPSATDIRDAADALIELRRERDEAVDWIRVANEETVLAGLPGGDRYQTLANIRTLTKRIAAAEARASALHADAERYRWIRDKQAMRNPESSTKGRAYWSIYADATWCGETLDTAVDAARLAKPVEP